MTLVGRVTPSTIRSAATEDGCAPGGNLDVLCLVVGRVTPCAPSLRSGRPFPVLRPARTGAPYLPPNIAIWADASHVRGAALRHRFRHHCRPDRRDRSG